ncbi:MAG TPA: hypothetical protein VFV94_17900 [Polyangiaceae bacterium]|nr:hypothetical protein [Polyangiaceae bacterium]
MARLNVQRLSLGMSLVGWAVLAAVACSSSASEEKKAAGVSQACTLNSDCSNPFVCAFQRCHQQCTETRDCDDGQRCVKQATKGGGEGGGSGGALVGVCQLAVEKTCATGAVKCATGQQCAEDKQCHDVCESNDECFDRQTCTPNGSCADMGETDSSGNIKPGVTSGSGGTGGTGMGNAGENGQTMGLGGDNGGNVVNECPDTKGDNPVMHDNGYLMDDESWSGLHRITGTLYLESTLELKPCTVVQLDQSASIYLSTGGAIHALGAVGNPVVFTSSKSPPAAGDWGGIYIQDAAANDSTFENVIIEYGGGNGGYQSPLRISNGGRASLLNVLVRHTDADSPAIQLDSGAEITKFVGVSTEDSKLGLKVAANTIGSLDSFTSDAAEISVQSETLTDDATWKDFGLPYGMSTYFSVHSVLTLSPGVTLKMPANATISVTNEGSLQSIGTKEKPVTFTSAKKSPDAGDWQYIQFDATSSNDSVLENTVVEYGGGYMIYVQNGASLGITDSTFQHSDDDGGCAVNWVSDSRITDFSGNTFVDTPCPISIAASQVGELGDFTADADSGDVSVQGGETLKKPITWSDHGSAYRLTAYLYVQTAFTIDEGVTIKMPTSGSFYVSGGGSMKVNGTSDNPVTFRSFIDDANDGDWQYIQIAGDAAQSSKFTYAVIKDSAKGFYVSDNKLVLDHVTFENNTCDLYQDTTSEVTLTSTDPTLCN